MDNGETVFSSSEVFPPHQWNEYYRTIGFKIMAYVHGDIEKGFAKTTESLNRTRHQMEEGTPLKTLHDGSMKEGLEIQEYLKRNAQEIFTQNDYTPEGAPENPILFEDPIKMDKEIIDAAYMACSNDLCSVDDLRKNHIIYESSSDSINIKIDDVLVKRQDSTHHKKGSLVGSKKKSKKNTSNTVCTIDSSGEKYALNGFSTKEVLLYLVAFIIKNKLIGKRLQIFTDGLPVLNSAIEKCFSWYMNIMIILDWYHLEKKCKERLSMGVKDRKFKDSFLHSKLMPLLWNGQADEAIKVLRSINESNIKKQDEIDKLIEYLQRNKRYIPCYSMRKELGLCISSNECEKMNDILVSARQKNNGMSWVKKGSTALASLTALKKNNEYERWFQTGTLEYNLVA